MPPPHELHILLAEDDDVDALAFRTAMSSARLAHPLHVARDGVEALRLLKSPELRYAPKVVLSDLEMPRMGGLELLRRLRHDPELSATPVVVLSSLADVETLRAAYGLRAAGYLIKPQGARAMGELVRAVSSYWTRVELP